MKIYYYCSYTFSPLGFQFRCYDTDSGFVKVSNENPDDKMVVTLLTRGGSESAFGVLSNGRYYFTLKRIIKKAAPASDDEPEKTWNINVAVSADSAELPELCALAYGAYTDFVNFGDRIMSTLAEGDGDIAYTIDIKKLEGCISDYSAIYLAALSGDVLEGFSCPCDLAPEKLEKALESLCQQSISNLFQCVILSSTKSYFYKNTGFSPEHTIPICVYLIEPSVDEEMPRTHRAGSTLKDYAVPIALGAGAFALGYVGLRLIGRVFRRK